MNILSTKLSQSVWENLDLGHVYSQDSAIQTSCSVNKSQVHLFLQAQPFLVVHMLWKRPREALLVGWDYMQINFSVRPFSFVSREEHF